MLRPRTRTCSGASPDTRRPRRPGPYQTYRHVLAAGLRGVAGELGFEPSPEESAAFSGSVVDWPAFPDSADALARLKSRYRLGVITNCDDDLFAASNERLGVDFDWIVTAQQVRSYKPAERGFLAAFERIGLPRDRILHVAQSLFHDHAPAQRLGHDDGVDRSTPGAPRFGCHARGHRHAERHVPGYGVLRRGGRSALGRGAAGLRSPGA